MSAPDLSRQCSKTGCTKPSTSTLTYVYADSTMVIGPLATFAEPHSYDLCADHAARMTAPRGWDVLRLADDQQPPADHDDLVALADVVRRARTGEPEPGAPVAAATPPGTYPVAGEHLPGGMRESGRRGHLRVLSHRDPR